MQTRFANFYYRLAECLRWQLVLQHVFFYIFANMEYVSNHLFRRKSGRYPDVICYATCEVVDFDVGNW